MITRSIFTGALLGALVVSGIAVRDSAMAATEAAAQNATTTFNVYLPLTNTDSLEQLLEQQADSNSPNYHKWLTPAQFKQQFGPSAASFAAARAVLENAAVTVIAEHTQNLTALNGKVDPFDSPHQSLINRKRYMQVFDLQQCVVTHDRICLLT